MYWAVGCVWVEVMRRWWSRDFLCGVIRGMRRVRMRSSGRGGDCLGMRERIVDRETERWSSRAVMKVVIYVSMC